MAHSNVVLPRKQSFKQSKAQLTMKIEGSPAIRIAIETVDESMLAQLSDQITNSVGFVKINLTSFASWPDGQRWLLLNLLKTAKDRLIATVRGKAFSTPFEAVVATLLGGEDLDAHGTSLRGTIEAAAIFHPDMPLQAAQAIRKRLTLLGASVETAKSLAKQISALAGSSDGASEQGKADPRGIAEHFITDQRAKLLIENACSPVVLYHRDEFYFSLGKVWRRVEDAELDAIVTHFMQVCGIENITHKLMTDVITNLKGIGLLQAWKIDPPFYITTVEPMKLSPRRYIIFQNLLVKVPNAPGKIPSVFKHSSHYFSTSMMPFSYDRQAECLKWQAFLNEVLPIQHSDDHRQDVLQEFVGYLFLSDCRFEKGLILYGPPRSGKSTIMSVLESLLGDENVSHIPFDQLNDEFRLGELRGKSANISSELDHLSKAREALLKQLISGEPINVNRKHKSPIEMRPHAKIVVAANDLPSISDTSGGVWRRLSVIVFQNPISPEQVNTSLARELKDELPGIFNWAMKGLQRLLAQNRFTTCSLCEQELAEYRTASDSVAEFFDECCTHDPLQDSHSGKLYELYVFFSSARNRRPVQPNEFGKRAKRLNYAKRRATPLEDLVRPYLYQEVCLNPMGHDWLTRYLRDRNPGWNSLSYTANTDAALINDQELVDAQPGNDGPSCPGSVQDNPDGVTNEQESV